MHPSEPKPPVPSWTREQIRDARQTNLEHHLEKRGHLIIETGGGNCRVPDYPGLIVKAGYWRWPERDLSGNAIDFYVQVFRCNFHEAMTELTRP
jgi:hypothetical protein